LKYFYPESYPALTKKIKIFILGLGSIPSIEKGEDSIIFYKLRTNKYFTKETMGVEKGLEDR